MALANIDIMSRSRSGLRGRGPRATAFVDGEGSYEAGRTRRRTNIPGFALRLNDLLFASCLKLTFYIVTLLSSPMQATPGGGAA